MTFNICRWLFLLLVVSLPLVRPFAIDIRGLQVPATDFIFIAVFVLWLIALLRGETRFETSKLYFFLGIYAVALTVSTIFSTEPQRSILKLPGEFYLLSLAILTFNLVRDEKFFRRTTYAWLLGTMLTVLASLTGFVLFYLGLKTQSANYFLSHIGSLPEGNYPRIQALFANPNMLANYLNVSLMFAVVAGKNGWLGKISARVVQTGIWFAGVWSLSPGLGGMLLSIGIWCWADLRQKKRFALSKLCLASALFFAVVIFASTLVSPDTGNTQRDLSMPFTERKLEPSVRVLVWENAWQRFVEHPLVGRGTGTNAAQFQYQTISGTNQLLLDAHNMWLNVLGQTGLFGIAAFSALVFYLILRCRFRFPILDNRNFIHLALSSAFVGAFLYQGLSGSFEDARHLWILFGMLAGISTSWKSEVSEESSEQSDRPSI